MQRLRLTGIARSKTDPQEKAEGTFVVTKDFTNIIHEHTFLFLFWESIVIN